MSAPGSVLLVVPWADDDTATDRLLALARALTDVAGLQLTVLCWAGPRHGAFAEVAPTVDAGAVNRWGPARLLAKAHLGPAARLLKNRRLRDLLRPLGATPTVIVGGVAGTIALGWLPRAIRTTAVLAGLVEGTLGEPPTDPALSDADVVVATGPDVERWLAGVVADDHLRRHALVDGPETTVSAPDRIGLVGWTAPDVTELLTASNGRAITWFVDEPDAWGLWQGPDASPVAAQVRLASPNPRTTDLADLQALVVGAPSPDTAVVARAAGAFGVPVVTAGARAVVAATTAIAEPPPAGSTSRWTRSLDGGVSELVADLVAAGTSRR